jgi:hypothetical protein
MKVQVCDPGHTKKADMLVTLMQDFNVRYELLTAFLLKIQVLWDAKLSLGD